MSTGAHLHDVLRNNEPISKSEFGTDSSLFCEQTSLHDDAFDVFVWQDDIKRGTHISIDQNSVPEFPPPRMQIRIVRFFVCANDTMKLMHVYAVNAPFVFDMRPKIAKYYMFPVKELNDVLVDGITVEQADDNEDAMDIDEGDTVEVAEPPTDLPVKWMITNPFSLEAERIDRVIVSLLGEEYAENMEGPLFAYVQLMKEVLGHLCAPTDIYTHNMSNFYELYTTQYGFWLSKKLPKSDLFLFKHLEVMPTFEETRMFLLKRAAFSFTEEACELLCKADAAFCGFQHIVEHEWGNSDCRELIFSAISEFAAFTDEVQRKEFCKFPPDRYWWKEITPTQCIRENDQNATCYRIPMELGLELELRGESSTRWPGIVSGLAPDHLRLVKGAYFVDMRTMLLFAIPFLREILVRETLVIHRAMFYDQSGGYYFKNYDFLKDPTRVEEARNRQVAMDDNAHGEFGMSRSIPDIDEDAISMSDEVNMELLMQIEMFMPKNDWYAHDILDTCEKMCNFLLLGLPARPLERWRGADIFKSSPTLSGHGYPEFHFDKKLVAMQLKQVEKMDSAKFDGVSEWKSGIVSRLIPDIEDFASDGKHVDLLPPCMRNIATLAPPKKTKGATQLRNDHRLAAASMFLRTGYSFDDVICYISDGTSSRTDEARSVVISHIKKFFPDNDFIAGNQSSMPFNCNTLIENSKTSPSTNMHCTYAARNPTLSPEAAICQCVRENMPNHSERDLSRGFLHPLFLLWKRVKIAEL